jgi:hypothetical protein
MKTNDEWVRALRTHGIEQEDALKELREKLLRGMRAYLADNTGYRSVSSRPHAGGDSADIRGEQIRRSSSMKRRRKEIRQKP